MSRFRISLVAVALGAVMSASCAGTPPSDRALSTLDDLSATPSTTSRPSSSGAPCNGDDAIKSYGSMPALPPPKHMPADTYMHDIQDRQKKLTVGVDINTPGFGYRNPATGAIEGLEADLAREIAERIFGPRFPPSSLVLVPVTTEEKIDVVKGDHPKVDLTIDAVTMSCDRSRKVAFSTKYYTAVQKFLLRRDPPIAKTFDPAGRRICVTKGSSSIKILQEKAPTAIIHTVDERPECLVALQKGEVDAYFGHDSFLYGMAAQDPTLIIVDPVGSLGDTTSNYGIAINLKHPEFVRFVNAVLDQVRTGST